MSKTCGLSEVFRRLFLERLKARRLTRSNIFDMRLLRANPNAGCEVIWPDLDQGWDTSLHASIA